MQTQDSIPQTTKQILDENVPQVQDQDTFKSQEEETKAQFYHQTFEDSLHASLGRNKEVPDIGHEKSEQLQQHAQLEKIKTIFFETNNDEPSLKATRDNNFGSHQDQDSDQNISDSSCYQKNPKLSNQMPERPQGEDEYHYGQELNHESDDNIAEPDATNEKTLSQKTLNKELKEQIISRLQQQSYHEVVDNESEYRSKLQQNNFQDVEDLKNQSMISSQPQSSQKPISESQMELDQMKESKLRIEELFELLDEGDLSLDEAGELLEAKETELQIKIKSKKPKQNEITETQNKINLLNELLELLEDENGHKPMENLEFKDMKPKDQLKILSSLLKQRPIPADYKKYLLEESKCEIPQPVAAKSRILNTQRAKEMWKELNLNLFNIYLRGNDHWALKFYYQNESEQMINPTLISDVYDSLKIIVPPQCYQEAHNEFIEIFTEQNFDETIEQIEQFASEDTNSQQSYKEDLLQATDCLNQAIIKGDIIGQAYNELQISLYELKDYSEFNKCFKSLLKRKNSEAVFHLKELLLHANSKNRAHIFSMYGKIVKIDPFYKQVYPLKEFLRDLSPKNIQTYIDRLDEEIKRAKDQVHFVIGTLNNPSALLEILNKIFFEDYEYCLELIEFVGKSEDITKILNDCKSELRTLKELQQDHLETANSQIIFKKQKVNTVSKFLTVDTNQKDFESLQQNIIFWLIRDNQVQGKSLQNILFELIKKKCNFSDFITSLREQSQQQFNDKKDIKTKMVLSQQFLLSWLLKNSDTYLRTMLLISCSSFMPVPLITYQIQQESYIQSFNLLDIQNANGPKNNLQQPIFQPQIFEELFYCFDKNFSVLNFKISSNPNKSPQGCTSLANEVFNRNFETHSNSYVNFGCIDLQFDYNFVSPMFIPVADAHGIIEEEILNLVYPLFNIYVIHSFTGENDKRIIQTQIQKIKEVHQNPMIFIIYHDVSLTDNEQIILPNLKSINDPIQEIHIQKYIGLPEIEQKTLRNFISKCFIKKVSSNSDSDKKIKIGKEYEANDAKRIESLNIFLSFAKNFDQYRTQKFQINGRQNLEIEENLRFIIKVMDQIRPIQNELRSQKVLPLNELFYQASKYDRSMIKGNISELVLEKASETEKQNKSEVYRELREKINEIYLQISEHKFSDLTLCMREIIQSGNYLGLTTVLSKIIRSLLESLTKQEQEYRQQLTSEFQKYQNEEKSKYEENEKEILKLEKEIISEKTKLELFKDQQQELNNINQKIKSSNESLSNYMDRQKQIDNKKNEMFQQIKEATISIERKWFSLEFIYREFYIHGYSQLVCQNQQNSNFNDYLALATLQIQQGQPFEIIDGNNLQFIKDVYQQIIIGEAAQCKILVVSIVGPQSSGKSLLLNTLFGAQFMSSAGRCTRGIYGCLLDIKDNKRSFQKMLILDTEGIQGNEQQDNQFDKRVIFYILSISHIVLICNKGEINKGMEDILKLAINCITQVKQDIASHPDVNIVMNNTTSNVSLLQTTLNLQETLLKQNSSELFQINTENVFLLPNAFAQTNSGELISNNPSPDFAQKVHELKKKIYAFIDNVGDNSGKKPAEFNLKEWFQTAQEWWEFTDQYKGLTDYQTLEERLEDDITLKYVNEIIRQQFDNQDLREESLLKVTQDVTKVLQQHSGFDQTNIKDIQDKIFNKLQEGIIKKVTEELESRYKQFVDENGISLPIVKKRKENLNTQIQTRVFEWNNEAMKMLSDHSNKQSKFVGNKFLSEAVEHLIKYSQQNQSYSKNAVTEKEAEELFDKKWEEIKQQVKISMKKEQVIIDETEKLITQVYNSHGQTSNLQKFEIEVNLMRDYEFLNHQKIIDHLRQESEFFYFKSITKKSKPSSLMEKQKKEKNYFQNNDLQFFEEVKTEKYYMWYKLIKDRFDFNLLLTRLQKINEQSLHQKDKKFQFMRFIDYKRGELDQVKLDNLFKEIQNEAKEYSVSLSDLFKLELLSLEQQIQNLIDKKIKYQGKEADKTKRALQKLEWGNEAIKQFVSNVEENIIIYFVSQKQFKQAKDSTQFFKYYYVKQYNLNKPYSWKYCNFYCHNYLLTEKPQEQVKNEYELVSNESRVEIKQDVKDINYFLLHLIDPTSHHINPRDQTVNLSRIKFTELLNHQKLLREIQNAIFANIFRNEEVRKKFLVEEEKENIDGKYQKSMEDLIRFIQDSDRIDIPGNFVTINFETTYKIVQQIELIGENINSDLEIFGMKVSENGFYCLHRITKTYLIRLMREVKKITEYTPYHSFLRSKEKERGLFVAKLTSNDKKADNLKAYQIADQVADTLANGEMKKRFFKLFERKIQSESKKFYLKNIREEIEFHIQNYIGSKISPILWVEQNLEKGELLEELNGLKRYGENQKLKRLPEMQKKISLINQPDLKLDVIDIIQFYVNPAQFLERIFKNRWEDIAGPMIKKIQDEYQEEIKTFRTRCFVFFDSFYQRCKSREIPQLALDIFVPLETAGNSKITQDIKYEEFKTLSKQALAKYFIQFILKEDQIFSENEQKVVFKISNVTMESSVQLINHRQIDTELDQQTIEIIIDLLKIEDGISNLTTFLQDLRDSFNEKLDPEKNDIIQLTAVQLHGDIYQSIRTKTIGCQKFCPLCRRQCDQNHMSKDEEHSCESHQIQGFGGNINLETKKVCIQSCSDFKVNDKILEDGQELEWPYYVKKMRNELNFNFETVKSIGQRKQSALIWNQIGKLICQFYKYEKTSQIEFEMADENYGDQPKPKKTTYILILDESRSMESADGSSGKTRWQNVIDAAQKFADELSKGHLMLFSTITLITYNQEAEIQGNQLSPIDLKAKLSSIKLKGGSTNFGKPLSLALNTSQLESHKNTDQFHFIMMSDGEARYPQQEVQDIQNCELFKQKKIQFTAIGYGAKNKFDILNQIATELGGALETIAKPSQLQQSFIRLAANAYLVD